MISESSLTVLSMGAIFGLTAGISPGPLLTLVISETLQHSRSEGIKVALAPLITDVPIILITWLIFSQLSHFGVLLSIISFSGAVYFAFLGYNTMKIKELNINTGNIFTGSLKKGITANFLNPNPYIFWFTAGIPTAFKAYETSLQTAVIYFLLFYIMLTGSKILIALLVERSKVFLNNRSYVIVMRILGVVLFIFACIFVYDGIKILKSVQTPSL
jgi:threonine/homoserine/homoserine lactone efflux protein